VAASVEKAVDLRHDLAQGPQMRLTSGYPIHAAFFALACSVVLQTDAGARTARPRGPEGVSCDGQAACARVFVDGRGEVVQRQLFLHVNDNYNCLRP